MIWFKIHEPVIAPQYRIVLDRGTRTCPWYGFTICIWRFELRIGGILPKVKQKAFAFDKTKWPDPTPEMRETAEFEAVWQRIKSWDINVPEVDGESSYSGATSNHVRAILDALDNKETIANEMIEEKIRNKSW